MLLVQSPNTRQIMEEKVTGKRFNDIKSLSRADRMAYETERAGKRA